MEWALYGAGAVGAPNRALRLHLSLNILEDKPQVAALQPGKICKRKVWRHHWRRGQAYVGDRYFGEDYKAFGELQALDCSYVIRLLEQAAVNLEEELPLGAEDLAAGVERQAWVTLGGQKRYRSVRLRVVWVRTREGNLVILATNLTSEQLAGHLIWLLYKQRWKVEMCQTQPHKMTGSPLRPSGFFNLAHLRGRSKREGIVNLDLLSGDHHFFDQTLDHGLAIFKGELVQVLAE